MIHPSTTSLARYLEDLFLHMRGCSRRVDATFKVAEAAAKRGDVDSEVVDHENTVSGFLARVAPVAIERMQLVQIIAPGYDESLSSLEPAQVDALVQPLFEAAGILDDFIPWQERFPRMGIEEAMTGRAPADGPTLVNA